MGLKHPNKVLLFLNLSLIVFFLFVLPVSVSETDWLKFFLKMFYNWLVRKRVTRNRPILMNSLESVFLSDLIIVTPGASDQYLLICVYNCLQLSF